MVRVVDKHSLENAADDHGMEIKFLIPASMVYELDKIAYDRFSSRAEVIRGACRAIIFSEAEKRKQRASLH